MNDDERFQELRENEIKRLTTPLTYSKGKWNVPSAYFDCEGNEVHPINTFNGKKYIIEPKKGILSDDEILMYAGESVFASEIRLKRGIGTKSDKRLVNDNLLTFLGAGGTIALIILALFAFVFDYFIGKILFFLTIVLIIGYYSYIMYIKDYTDSQYKNNLNKELEHVEEQKIATNNDLLLLFKSKEKIAREMIERRFPSPQLTNAKFNAVLDNCKDVVESQIEILNALTPTEKTQYEINSRKKLIKKLISKIDDLTNELILSEENNIENVIDDMDNLIKSVKYYE